VAPAGRGCIVGVFIFYSVFCAADAGAFGHASQQPVGIHLTHAARHCPVIAECVFEAVTHHAVFPFGALKGAQVVGNHLESVPAIEIVGVDDGKRLMNHVLGHQDGVVCAPGLFASFGHREAFGQFVQLLG